MKSNWQEEVEKFREWAATRIAFSQAALYFGEWECDYNAWQPIRERVGDFLRASNTLSWSEDETKDLLYILARDNEDEVIANELKQRSEVALFLASKSLEGSDWDARWQLADVLGHLSPDARIEPLLLRFANDEEEYVRRRALQSLTRLGSSQVEQLALREWNRESQTQQWARMNALSCWNSLNSPLLEPHLREAEASDMEHLADYARRLRSGEVDSL